MSVDPCYPKKDNEQTICFPIGNTYYLLTVPAQVDWKKMGLPTNWEPVLPGTMTMDCHCNSNMDELEKSKYLGGYIIKINEYSIELGENEDDLNSTDCSRTTLAIAITSICIYGVMVVATCIVIVYRGNRKSRKSSSSNISKSLRRNK